MLIEKKNTNLLFPIHHNFQKISFFGNSSRKISQRQNNIYNTIKHTTKHKLKEEKQKGKKKHNNKNTEKNKRYKIFTCEKLTFIKAIL